MANSNWKLVGTFLLTGLYSVAVFLCYLFLDSKWIGHCLLIFALFGILGVLVVRYTENYFFLTLIFAAKFCLLAAAQFVEFGAEFDAWWFPIRGFVQNKYSTAIGLGFIVAALFLYVLAAWVWARPFVASDSAGRPTASAPGLLFDNFTALSQDSTNWLLTRFVGKNAEAKQGLAKELLGEGKCDESLKKNIEYSEWQNMKDDVALELETYLVQHIETYRGRVTNIQKLIEKLSSIVSDFKKKRGETS